MPGQSSLFLRTSFLISTKVWTCCGDSFAKISASRFCRSILNITTPQRNIHCIKSGLSLIGSNFSLQHHRTPVAISPKLTHWLSHKVKMLLDDQIHPNSLFISLEGSQRNEHVSMNWKFMLRWHHWDFRSLP